MPQGSGRYPVDPGSRFEDKHEAKRFGDSDWEVRPKGGRAVNPRTMQTYYFYENGTRLIAQYRSGSKAIALKYFAKSFPFVYRRGNFTVTTTNGRAVNPRTLVSAKLQRMPNGTIKVLVSPGAVAKLKAQSSNPSMKNAYIIDETTGKIVKTGMSWAAAYKQAETWTKNSRNKHTYLAMEAKPSGRAPIGKWDGRQ